MAKLRHDLRNCVNQILGYSDLLREEAEECQPNFVPDLDHIRDAGARILKLLDGLFADAQFSESGAAPAVLGDCEAELSLPVPSALGAHILVVDDDELNRNILSRRLQKQGFGVDEAVDGAEALRKVASLEYDLILLDVTMPVMSGLEVLERVRREHHPADLPVIMATAAGQSADVVAALHLGANDYVTKPLDFPVVIARVTTQLMLKRAVDENRALLLELEIRNRFIRQTFGRYLSDQVVSSLLDDRGGLELGGEKRRISIMVTDLRGFSSISEELEPQKVVTILNLYFEIMTEVILECGGTIDEFIGDSILVFFGAPVSCEDHASAALRCAVRMQLAMAEVNRRNVDRGFPPLEMGIGIHTGEVVIGNVGSERRAKYGAVGSNVNLASRIESYTVGGQILVSEATWREAGESFLQGKSMLVHPKGMAEPVRLYEVLGVNGNDALRLPDLEIPLIALELPLPVRYIVLDGKDASGTASQGELTKLSQTGAELRLSAAVASLTNLKLTLGGEARGDLYAKVLEESTEAGCVAVRFTAISPEVQAWIKPLV
jgi:adenylate cyclase